MNTDLNPARIHTGMPRPAPAAPAPASQASSTAAVAVDAKPAVKMPEKAKLTLDPEQTRKQLQEAIQMLNERMQKTSQQLNFRMDEVMDIPVVTVRSTATGEVIRQIPNETVIHVAHNIEAIKGLLHNSTS